MSPTPDEPQDEHGDGAAVTADGLRRRLAFMWWHALRRFKSHVERESAGR